MNNKITLILFLVIAMSLSIKAQSVSVNKIVDENATQEVKNLYGNLKEVAWDNTGNDKAILFGQEFFNTLIWKDGNNCAKEFSDFKDVTTDHPAVLGQDFQFYITKGATNYQSYKAAAQYVYSQGGVVTFDYHIADRKESSTKYVPEKDKNGKPDPNSNHFLMYNIANGINDYEDVTWYNEKLDKVVAIINDLKIPVVVRLFHEMNGGWFWWGSKSYEAVESHKKIYQYSVNYIKARTNYALYAWSPDRTLTENYYPGDDYVDVVGLDIYDNDAPGKPSLTDLVNDVEKLSDFAWNHKKIPVLSEVGNRDESPDAKPDWWIRVNNSLQTPGRRANKIAWMLTWVNRPWNNPAYPYNAHSTSSAQAKQKLTDFKNLKTILTLEDSKTRKMYDASYKNDNLLGIEDFNLTNKVLLYPNPTKDGLLNFNLATANELDVKVTFTDILGREVLTSKNSEQKPTFSVSVQGLAKGIYIVKINGVDFKESHKVIIE
jgi:mannan endo-1,4-beta-mannosidase